MTDLSAARATPGRDASKQCTRCGQIESCKLGSQWPRFALAATTRFAALHDLPVSVLADLLDLDPTTARWSKFVQRDWTGYVAERR
jgi:hypothetical protein